MPTILSLFDRSHEMVRPWVAHGYDAICVDIEPALNPDDDIEHFQYDLRDWMPPKHIVRDICFVAAFPPCTDLSVSGARWMPDKGLKSLARAIELFGIAVEWCEYFGVPYLIENPVSVIATHYRQPDYQFHPAHYTGYCLEDNYRKKTCLWTGNGFKMPDKKMATTEIADSRIHHAAPGEQRSMFRSMTPKGFALAVYEANKPDVLVQGIDIYA